MATTTSSNNHYTHSYMHYQTNSLNSIYFYSFRSIRKTTHFIQHFHVGKFGCFTDALMHYRKPKYHLTALGCFHMHYQYYQNLFVWSRKRHPAKDRKRYPLRIRKRHPAKDKEKAPAKDKEKAPAKDKEKVPR